MNRTTKGAIEADVSNAVVRFHREQQGRGPTDVRASVIGDVIMVRCSGVFTPTEAHLCATEQGRRLIKSSRQELRGINHAEIEALVASIAGVEVVRSFYDIDVIAGEQFEIFVLAADLEKRLLRQELDHLNRLAPRRDK